MRGNSLRRNTAFNLNQAQFFKPQTQMEANRWLSKACIGGGATPVMDLAASSKTNFVPLAGYSHDAADLMDVGYAAWIDNQLYDVENYDIPINPDPLYIETDEDVIGLTFGTGTGDEVYHKWFETLSLYGKTPLRLKMVYALSQIFAVRAQGNERGFMNSHVQSLYDATKLNNTSTFRQLLKEMTFSPVMGYWLTFENNKKADPAINRLPDENYAREVMQLFSIGLVCLNMDGTPMLDSEGHEIPTYTALDVKECAKFMTGLFVPDNNNFRFMRYANANHELASKKLFAYPGGSEVVLPAQTAYQGLNHWMPVNGYTITVVDANTFTVAFTEPKSATQTGQPIRYRTLNLATASYTDATASWTNGGTVATVTKTAHGLTTGNTLYIKHHIEDSIDAFLDHLFNHPSCPPFMAKALIKFFVTSNPSPGYVERVAKIFVNNGFGVRGQLASVVRAILLDREAIIPYDADPSYRGRHLTYYERLQKVLRGMRSDIVHLSKRGFAFKTSPSLFTAPRTTQDYSGLAFNSYYGMNKPFSPPSVFNFYRPGYVPPATDLASGGYTGPELQINTPEAQTVWPNVVCAALNYISSGFNYGPFDNLQPYTRDNLLDPRGSIVPNVGFDFVMHPSGFTVTGKTADSIIIQGTITGSCKAPSYVNRVWIYNRTKAEYKFSHVESSSGFITGGRPANAGVQTFNIFVDWDGGTGQYDIGDVLDFHPALYLPHGGFTGHAELTGGGEPGSRLWSTHIPLLYTFCMAIPDTETVTDPNADNLIDYIQDIYMGRPISAELRTIMRDLIKLPVTLAGFYNGLQDSNDPAVTNHCSNFFYDRSQIRVRRALAALFLSPEFSIVD